MTNRFFDLKKKERKEYENSKCRRVKEYPYGKGKLMREKRSNKRLCKYQKSNQTEIF
jgi:hypothetical protein